MIAIVSILALVGLWVAFYAWPIGDTDPETPFAVVGNTDQFASLTDAVSTAQDGDIIEINGNGPFLVASLDAAEKSLTIQIS